MIPIVELISESLLIFSFSISTHLIIIIIVTFNTAGLMFDSTPYNETLVTRGNDVNINCDVSGNPAPYPIQWLRNHTLITPTTERIVINDGSITLFNAQPNDTAIYQCVAMTTTERISAYTYLIVECEL